jgi:hypothetical protein
MCVTDTNAPRRNKQHARDKHVTDVTKCDGCDLVRCDQVCAGYGRSGRNERLSKM